MRPVIPSNLICLANGDAAILAAFTVIGFANHGELADSGFRMLVTFLMVFIAWSLVAPWFGLFSRGAIAQPRSLWRVILAAFVAAPLAGWLREIALNEVDPPIFFLVMAAITALMLLVRRGAFIWISRRQVQHG